MTTRHPGRVLREDFMDPLDMSVAQLANLAGVSQQRIYQLLQQRRSITADTALRLGLVFRMNARHWLAMQAAWDLERLPSPTDVRQADLRGFVTGPLGVLHLPPSPAKKQVDTSFSPEMLIAVERAAALLAPFEERS